MKDQYLKIDDRVELEVILTSIEESLLDDSLKVMYDDMDETEYPAYLWWKNNTLHVSTYKHLVPTSYKESEDWVTFFGNNITRFGLREDYPFGKLEELREGDPVIYQNSLGSSFSKIERVTKTQIITSGLRFRKKCGSAIGDISFSSPFITSIKSEKEMLVQIYKWKKRKALREVKELKFNELSLVKLENILKVANESEELVKI